MTMMMDDDHDHHDDVSDDEEEVLFNIASIANPLYFQQCQVDKFEADFANYLKTLVHLSSKKIQDGDSVGANADINGDVNANNNISTDIEEGMNLFRYKYDPKLIEKCLFQPLQSGRTDAPTNTNTDVNAHHRHRHMHGNSSYIHRRIRCCIPWKSLCRNHETYYNRIENLSVTTNTSTSTNTSTKINTRTCHRSMSNNSISMPLLTPLSTPLSISAMLNPIPLTALEAIIKIIINPSIIPSCYTTIIIIGLLSSVCPEIIVDDGHEHDDDGHDEKLHSNSQSQNYYQYQSRVEKYLRGGQSSSYVLQNKHSSHPRQYQQQHLNQAKQLKCVHLIQSAIHCLIQSRPTVMTISNPIKTYMSRSSLFILNSSTFPLFSSFATKYNDLHCNSTGTGTSISNDNRIKNDKKTSMAYIKKVLINYNVSKATEMISFVKNLVLYNNNYTNNTNNKSNRNNTQQPHKQQHSSATHLKIPITTIIVPILSLLKELDGMDVFMLQYKQERNERKSSSKKFSSKKRQDVNTLCAQCVAMYGSSIISSSTTNNRKARPMIVTSQLNELHDEQQSDNDGMKNIPLSLRRKHHHHQSKQRSKSQGLGTLSLNKIMSASNYNKQMIKSQESCYICIAKRNASTVSNNDINTDTRGNGIITALPIHMVYYRSFLYHTVIEITKAVTAMSFLSTKSSSSINILFKQVIAMVLEQPQSSSLRYCAILIADYIGFKKGYKMYLSTLLRIFNKCKFDIHRTRTTSPSSSNSDTSCNTTTASQQINRAVSCLYIYCEVVGECSVFDDPNKCWAMIRPLINIAIQITKENNNNLEAEEEVEEALEDEKGRSKIQYLMPCIGYLFRKRHTCLSNENGKMKMSYETSYSLNQYIIQCSDIFSSNDDDNNDSSGITSTSTSTSKLKWVHPLMPREEQIECIVVLQKLGILSFLQINNDMNITSSRSISSNNTSGFYYYNKDCWPFVDNIRHASKRMGPKVQCHSVFTNNCERKKAMTENENNINKRNHKISTGRKNREDSISGEPILEYINDIFLTRYIFSFLGYKLLVRVTGVCKQWNIVGNGNFLWKAHYQKRFKLTTYESLLPKSTDADIRAEFLAKYKYNNEGSTSSVNYWRQLFDNKWRKEKSLRTRVSSSDGWKVKTCDMLGCLTVLSTRRRREQHEQMHIRDVRKKVDTLIRIRERRVKTIEAEGLLNKKRKMRRVIQNNQRDNDGSNVRKRKKTYRI